MLICISLAVLDILQIMLDSITSNRIVWILHDRKRASILSLGERNTDV